MPTGGAPTADHGHGEHGNEHGEMSASQAETSK